MPNVSNAVRAVGRALLYFLVWVLLVNPVRLQAQPGPGAVYREYLHVPPSGWERVTDLQAWAPLRTPENPVRTFLIGDLDQAVAAEVMLELWSGHAGTSNKRFRVNGGDWINVPEPGNIPGTSGSVSRLPASCYQYFTYPTIAIPLDALRQGENTLQFGADGQVCFDFGWGQWGAYGVTFRIYYDEGKAHPSGRITAPAAGSGVNEAVRLEAVVSSPNDAIAAVDFIGRYEDVDYESNGQYRQWHYSYRLGRIRHHLGTAEQAPYEITWNTAWVPDQQEPMEFMARIRDVNGMTYMTPAVGGVTLERRETSVQLYKPYDQPPNWVSRLNKRLGNKVFVKDDLRRATDARLVVSTWNGRHGIVDMNDAGLRLIVGQDHRPGYNEVAIPLEHIRFGRNFLFALSGTSSGHGIEVMWPGIVLLVRYQNLTDATPLQTTVLLVDRPTSGWGLENHQVTTRPVAFDGRAALEVQPAADWRLVLQAQRPEAPFGYTALRFAFHPGAASAGEFDFFVNDSGVQLGTQRRGRVQRLVGGGVVAFDDLPALGVDPGLAAWQEIELPLRSLDLSGPLARVGFSGDLQGRFYLADLRLVVGDVEPNTAIVENAPEPTTPRLLDNFPNPFNSATTIGFSLSQAGPIELAIYNLSGQRIVLLAAGGWPVGVHHMSWDGRDQRGRLAATGIYLYRLSAGGRIETRKLLLMR